MKYINEDSKFWEHSYRIHLSEFDNEGVLVNANNEQDALDYAIDYHEEQGNEGLFLSHEEVEEKEQEGFLDDYMNGGNHGRYLSSFNVRIDQLD